MTGLAYVLFIKNISATHLAEKLGVSSQLVSHWITGRRDISDEHISRIEGYLGISSEYLIKTVNAHDRIRIESLLMGEDIEATQLSKVLVEMENLQVNYNKLFKKYQESNKDKQAMKENIKSFIDTL